MRAPTILRLDADLLVVVRVEAKRDSRTLTNFSAVAVKRQLSQSGSGDPAPTPGWDAAARGPADSGVLPGAALGAAP